MFVNNEYHNIMMIMIMTNYDSKRQVRTDFLSLKD